jgi:hypothetical protein
VSSRPKTSHVTTSDEPGVNPAGLLTIKITESPRKNILLTYRSLLMDVPLEVPFPPLEVSVHISLTSSKSLYSFKSWQKAIVKYLPNQEQVK